MRKSLPLLTALVVVLASGALLSTTYNSPNVDGVVSIGADDWDTDELAFRDPDDDCRFVPTDGDLVGLYVTWDADSLYVGVTTTNGPGSFGNGYVLFIDLDGQEGITGATDFTNADFYPRKITFSTMGADVVMGGWNFEQPFDVRHCSYPNSTSPVAGFQTEYSPDSLHVEASIPWDSLYGLGAGIVPNGTTLRFIAAVVGGNGSGAYDALPTSTMGTESNPGHPWDAPTDLDTFVEVVVDGNLDGTPDDGYPVSISGTVELDEEDLTSVATVTAYQSGEAVASGSTGPGGGEYSVYPVQDGVYDLTATAPSYLDSTISDVTISNSTSVTGKNFTLTLVTGRIEGAVALEGGQPTDVVVTVYDSITGEVGGEGPFTVEGGTGPFSIGVVLDGSYIVEATGLGFVEAAAPAEIVDGDTAHVGLLTLHDAVATKYGFVDSLGNSIYGASTTVSSPDDSVFLYASAWVEPRDDADRAAVWDTSAQNGVLLSVSKLDPLYLADGNVILADDTGTPIPDNTLTRENFVDGRAAVLVADDVVEVLRLQASKNALEGVLEVGIGPPLPVELLMSAADETITVDDEVGTLISAQLKDASGNDAKIEGVIANMVFLSGTGSFSDVSPTTDTNGSFDVEFWGTVANTAVITAVMDPSTPYNLRVDTLSVVLLPAAPSFIEMGASPSALAPGGVSTITGQIVDEWGNAVELGGIELSLVADPPELVAYLETPVTSDDDGAFTATIEAADDFGLIEVTGSAANLVVETVYIPVDATIAGIDETAPESDPAHNSDPNADLTVVRATNTPEDLNVALDFESGWGGIHLGLAVETRADPSGAPNDPFTFPIAYRHENRPDYIFTYKYTGNDYADFRRWTGSGWEYWDLVAGEWTSDGNNPDKNALPWVTKTSDRVTFKMPISVIESAIGSDVRLEAYVMQEFEETKYNALDSCPADSTHDMVIDPPDTSQWWQTATDTVYLHNYLSYMLVEEGIAPILSDGDAAPDTAHPGTVVKYTVNVVEGRGGVGDVLIDLSELGGAAVTRMRDDGVPPDATAGDGDYTAEDEVRSSATAGLHTVVVTAKDATNIWASILGIDITVDNPPVLLRPAFIDSTGDDHGPNKLDDNDEPVEGLYYFYPTNLVFAPGSFDIERFELFADGDWLVFRTFVNELVSHQEPGAADWGAPEPNEQTCDDPYRTDMNLQKIDIYVDAKEAEGSTSGFPGRNVDVAAVDAWDYGMAVEGWGKWFVVSNASNSSSAWDRLTADDEIVVCNNHFENYIDIRVKRELFGDPSDEDVANWDIILCLLSHDGDTNDQNLGGTRGVDANTAEWYFGGGRDNEGGRERDAHIIDVAAMPGEGHDAGRSQEDMLNYLLDEAVARFENEKVACVLEASVGEDKSPPAVYPFKGDPDVPHIPWVALTDAPAVLWTTITDVSGVEVAEFHWHTHGDTNRRSVDMVNLTGDIWAADIDRQSIVDATNVLELNKTGPARVIVGRIYAMDASARQNEIWAGPFEIAIPEPWVPMQTITDVDALLADGAEHAIVFQDGTVLTMDSDALPTSTGGVDLSLSTAAGSAVDLSHVRSGMEFVDVARELKIKYSDGTFSTRGLAGSVDLTMHYPEYSAVSLDQEKLGIFGWADDTDRWLLVGGNSDPANNVVDAEVSELGLFGIFYWPELGFDSEVGLSGVTIEPNPFSPNGDGLYDETRIGFYLGRDADHVTIEFYDLAGRLANRLIWHQPTEYTGRTPVEIKWDGTDEHGSVVPYGIYIMRVEAKFKLQPTYERVNRSVVVIK